jgi:hypothetical protein
MSEELEKIKARRVNIYLVFSLTMIILLAAFYIADSLMTRYESSLIAFKPLAKSLKGALGESGEGVKEISKSGVKVLDALSNEIPNIQNNVDKSSKAIKNEYKELESQLIGEYKNAKADVISDYRQFKIELKNYKNKIDNDIIWLKTEIENWRQLLIIISIVLGLIVTLISVKDILENIRWLLTFTGLFKAKNKETDLQLEDN